MAIRLFNARNITPKNEATGDLEYADLVESVKTIRANVERDYARLWTAHII
jgi:hypothetical protein